MLDSEVSELSCEGQRLPTYLLGELLHLVGFQSRVCKHTNLEDGQSQISESALWDTYLGGNVTPIVLAA